MSVDMQRVRSASSVQEDVIWGHAEIILYSLAIGFGRDELERSELPFIYEGAGLRCTPTFAHTLPSPSTWDAPGLAMANAILVESELEVFSPLLPADEVALTTQLTEAFDPGDQSGIYLIHRTEARRQHDNRALFSMTQTRRVRGQHGDEISGQSRLAPAASIPERDADFVMLVDVPDEQPALFRLCGDFNPIYVDPDAAHRAGFERPILPAECLQGIACRSVLATVCDYDTTLIRAIAARVCAPVYAGDQLRVSMWQDGPVISYRVFVPARDSLVLDNGRCVLTS